MAADRERAEKRLHLELAIALYREGQLGPGLAADVAGLSRAEFEEVLRLRQAPMPYTCADLEHDLAYARGDR
ncbi:MAG: UPF0175 family protein [Verrucomicrobia bacterium]|nr:UPF0175 family protein [Verrucomicrobiota bacterium]